MEPNVGFFLIAKMSEGQVDASSKGLFLTSKMLRVTKDARSANFVHFFLYLAMHTSVEVNEESVEPAWLGRCFGIVYQVDLFAYIVSTYLNLSCRCCSSQ